MTACASELVGDVFRRWLAPRRTLSVPQWAEAHRVVAKPSPMPGPWRNDTAPHLVEPMADFSDPAVSEIVCMFSPQTGKTELLLNCLLWSIDQDPDDAMIVLADADLARQFSRRRLIPAIRACPKLAEQITRDRDDVTLQAVHTRDCTVYLTGANSAGQLSNKPIRRPMLDELDKYPAELRSRGRVEGSAEELAEARADAFGARAVVVKTSTPTLERVGIHASFLRSDQAELYYPCPHCGGWQRLRFGQVRWEGGDGRELDDEQLAAMVRRVQREAILACTDSGCVITEADRRAMLPRGRWVRKGERIVGRGEDAIVAGDRIDTSVRGYHTSWLDSPFKSVGDVAAQFVERRGRVDQGYINRVLGEPWAAPGQSSDTNRLASLVLAQRHQAAQLRQREDETPPPHYQRGRAPVWVGDAAPPPPEGDAIALVLVGSADVQADRLKWQVAGYGAGERRYLIDWGETPWPVVPPEETGETTDAAAPVLERLLAPVPLEPGIPGVNAAEGVATGVDYWAIDSGHRTAEVYRLCERVEEAGGWAVPIKGDASLSAASPLEWTEASELADRSAAGRHEARLPTAAARARTMPVLRVDTTHWKDEVFRRMHLRWPEPGCWVWPQGEIDRPYLRELAGEHKVRVKKGSRGVVLRWEPRPGREAHDYWDCCRYELALYKYLTREQPLVPANAYRRAIRPEPNAARRATRPAQGALFDLERALRGA